MTVPPGLASARSFVYPAPPRQPRWSKATGGLLCARQRLSCGRQPLLVTDDKAAPLARMKINRFVSRIFRQCPSPVPARPEAAVAFTLSAWRAAVSKTRIPGG